MKRKITLISAAVLLVCCLILGGCGDTYTSSYKAVGFTQSNEWNKASMSFSEFSGTKVFTLEFQDSFSKSMIYSLKLETGSATVYYDTDGTKTKLVTVKSGDRINETLKDLTCKSMYIIVEASEKCLNGDFKFETKVL